MAHILGFLILGLAAGVLSGLIGIGGGVMIIPALVYFFGFAQHRAAGTTLALMVPPIGILAVIEYYRKGFVDIGAAAWICAGFVIGGLIGARYATSLSNVALQRAFGVFLLVIAVKMIFTSK
jgi:uncharacterized protein